MKTILLILVLLASATSYSQELPEFVMVSDFKPAASVYEDVLSLIKSPFGDAHGRSTNVHETAHVFHSEERRKRPGHNAFYCLEGRIVVLPEPAITMRHVRVPDVLKTSKWKIYFQEQLPQWNDVPTYPLEEWTAYILGAECAVQDHERGLPAEKSDCVSGCLEMGIYSIATAMTVKELDPGYWKSQPNFRKLIKFNLWRSEIVFFGGRKVFPSERQEKLLKAFREHEDATQIRNFMSEEFGRFFLEN